MQRYKHLRISAIILAFILFVIYDIAGQDVVNLDSLYFRARDLAKEQDYASAKKICKNILEMEEEYFDAQVLFGRTLYWEGKRDSAKREFINVLKRKVGYWDAVDGMIDVEMAQGKLDSALYFTKYGLVYHPNDEYFLLRKAEVQMRMEDYDESQRTILQVLDRNPSNEKAEQLLKTLKNVNILNYVSLDYDFEYYAEPWIRRWHLIYAGYSRRTPYGEIIGKVYFGDIVREQESLFSRETGIAFELEAYPQFTPKSYAYVSYTYSPSELFQRHRFGLEYYQTLPLALEVSLGGRLINYRKEDGGYDNLFIYTGSIGWYYKDYWISFRPYLVPKDYGTDHSYLLRIRRYIYTADNFVLLELGTGIIPDDPIRYPNDPGKHILNSYNIRTGIQYLLIPRLLGRFEIGYEYQEYRENKFRNAMVSKIRMVYYF